MLKPLFLAISVSLFAVACGGGQADPATADDAAKKDAPAATEEKKEGDAAKPAEGAAPAAGDPAKPADAAAAPK